MAEIMASGKVVLVDDDDLARLSAHRWRVTPQGYAMACMASGKRGGTSVLMHRMVMGACAGDEIDHINRDKLDNRKANLRLCTHAENCRNRGKWRGCSSQHRGVSWNKRRSCWQVVIRENGRLTWKGSYASELEAAKAAAPHFAGIAP